MTGTQCYQAARNLLSETAESGSYYDQFALTALNQVLANSLREINAERVQANEALLDTPPVLTTLEQDIPASEALARECFPYGLAALLVADDDKAKFRWAATEYASRLLYHCPAEYTAVQEML